MCTDYYAAVAYSTKDPAVEVFRVYSIHMNSNIGTIRLPNSGSRPRDCLAVDEKSFVYLSGGSLHFMNITTKSTLELVSSIAAPNKWTTFIAICYAADYVFAISQSAFKPLDLSIHVFDLEGESFPGRPAVLPLRIESVPICFQAHADPAAENCICLFIMTKDGVVSFEIQDGLH